MVARARTRDHAFMTRIVSWNLNERPPGKPAVWQYLREELGADIALVQEAVVPPDVGGVYRPEGIDGRDGKLRPWGSAVVALSDHVTLTAVHAAEGVWHDRGQGVAPLDCVDRGHVAAAVAEFDDRRLTLISAYGLVEF